MFAPPPPKEQVALKEMPALQRPPGALTANIREAMQTVAMRGPGQFLDIADLSEKSDVGFHITAPICHGTNSASPYPRSSDLVR